MKHRNEAFGRLLKAGIASIANCEGRTASVITERWGAFLDCYWRTEMLWDISVFAEERIPQAERALAVALQVGDAGVALRVSLRLARLYSFYRKLDAALAAFARAEQLYQQSDATLRAQLYGRMETTEATVLIFTGQPGLALERLDGNVGQDWGDRRHSRKQYWRALALTKLDRTDEAHQVLAALLAEYNPPPTLMTLCRAHGLAADIALDADRLDAGAAHLDEAMRAAHILQDRYQIARLDRTWARLDIRQGDLATARARLEAALDSFTRLGMAYDKERAQRDLARLGGDAAIQ